MEEAIVVSRLIRWAKWKLGSGKHLGFKPQISFVLLAGGYTARDDIDSECIETDDAVKQLPEFHRAVIRIEYLSECRNDSERAARIGISKRSLVTYRAAAYRYISDYLVMSQKKSFHTLHYFDTI